MSFDSFLKDSIQQDKIQVVPEKKIKDKLLQKFLSCSMIGVVHRNSFFSNSLALKVASIALVFYMGLNLKKLPTKLDSVSHCDSTLVEPLPADSVHSFQIIDTLLQ